jgi:hypothetical protein
MRHSDVAPSELRQAAVDDMALYLLEYELPEPGSTWGTPWSREKVAAELEKMRACLVDAPFFVEYLCEDFDPITRDPKCERRSGFVVAEDGSYRLLFDHEAEDFVLVNGSDDAGWGSFGIRGDASTTFLAR